MRATLPALPADRLEWKGRRYDVVVHEDSTGEGAAVTLRMSRREWPVARVPLPVRRVRRLDDGPNDPVVTQALARAFAESALLSGDVRTALGHVPRPSAVPVRIAAAGARPRFRAQ